MRTAELSSDGDANADELELVDFAPKVLDERLVELNLEGSRGRCGEERLDGARQLEPQPEGRIK
jgi:hypothetical protein